MTTLTPFQQSSYLAQVRRLRHLAEEALEVYSIKPSAINFIRHAENTTFKVQAKNNKKYLLRIHRNDYHSKDGILEEMNWLALLSKNKVAVPTPVRSKKGHLVETVFSTLLGDSRNCSMFEWIEGKMIHKSVRPEHLFEAGKLLAELQALVPKGQVKRRYWTPEGLVGRKPKFGSIDTIVGVKPAQQRLITDTRKFVLKKLKQFEKKFPKRQGLIHADLHFGNILNSDGQLIAIDFDDCGYGFYAYDLVIPLISVEFTLGNKDLDRYKDALIDGYTTLGTWDKADEEIYTHLYTARRLMMVGWLNSRSDNPRLKKYLAGSVDRLIKHAKDKYDF